MAVLSRGERFKDARTIYNQHGKQTMKVVEEATGVSASAIKDLEDDNSTRSVGYDKVASLSKHYGVTADWLLGLYPYPHREHSAVDELGLSPATIQSIKRLKEDSEEEFNDSISELGAADQMADFNSCRLAHGAFNRFIGSTLADSIVYTQISILANRIESLSAAEIPESLAAPEFLTRRVGAVATDISASAKLTCELYEKYPELAGLFHVQFGGESLKYAIDDICNTLRAHIEDITGYRAFMESRKPKGGNDGGNN